LGDKTIVVSQTFDTDEKVAAERFQHRKALLGPEMLLKRLIA
jgi:hypothetical protein